MNNLRWRNGLLTEKQAKGILKFFSALSASLLLATTIL